MIKPVSDWASSYEDLFFKKVTADKMPLLWGDWVHQNTTGLGAAPPWAAATVTLNRAAFPPINVPPSPTPALLCNLLSSGWAAYISSAIWAPPPPAPPFSAIALVTPSATGIGAAQPTLFSTLMGIFSAPAVASAAFPKTQAMQIATAFYTATMSSGIMLSGMSLPSPTPVPLVLPMMPVN